MKKITIAIACISMLSIASCAKERSCTCTNVGNSGNATVTTVKFTKISKGAAKDACSNNSRSYTSGSYSSSSKSDCKLN